MARRPFDLSDRAVKGPKLRASVDSPFVIGTKNAYEVHHRPYEVHQLCHARHLQLLEHS